MRSHRTPLRPPLPPLRPRAALRPQLELTIARLSAVQQLVERVEELESVNLRLSNDATQLRASLEAAAAEAAASRAAAESAAARADTADAEAARAREARGASTPRPRRDMGLLSDLLRPDELALVEQALIAGARARGENGCLAWLALPFTGRARAASGLV